MEAQTKVLRILNEEFDRLKMRNPAYSLRAYARKLKCPPSTLSGLLSGKLSVTRRMAERVLSELSIDPETIENAISPLENKNTNGAQNVRERKNVTFRQVDMDQYH